jgi:DNA polymerase-3 subunit beta
MRGCKPAPEVIADMELVARKADLVRELQFFQQIVERKNTIPILANVLIETDGNSIRLLATDIEVTLTSSCEAAVDRPGAITLPAKKLYEIVRALPDGDVKLSSSKDGTQVAVAAGGFESKMPTMPVADFPTPPTSEMAGASLQSPGRTRATT